MLRKFYFLLSLILFSYSNIFPQWFQQQTNTNCFISKIRMLNANTGFAIGDSSLLLRTTNGGLNWEHINTGTTPDDFFMGLHFINNETGWLCGGYMGGFGNSKIIKTTNSGFNWSIQYYQTSTYFFNIWFIDENTGFVVGFDGKFMFTSNGGVNWVDRYVTGVDIWTIQFLNSNTGFIAGNLGMIRKTTDGGMSFSLMNSSTQLRIASIFFTDLFNGYAVCDSETVLKTTDGGLNWVSQKLGSNIGYESVFFINQNTGYAVGNWFEIPTYKLIKTTNAGINWFTVQQGYGDPYFDIFFTDENTGWICGYNGLILKTTNGGGTFIKKYSEYNPQSYSLSQNYPNPFNSFTRIDFHIPEYTFVTLKIFNSIGQELKTIVCDFLSPDIYSVVLDLYDLPSGIYFYNLKTGNFSETKKLILIK